MATPLEIAIRVEAQMEAVYAARKAAYEDAGDAVHRARGDVEGARQNTVGYLNQAREDALAALTS